jgi:hypothetical protein
MWKAEGASVFCRGLSATLARAFLVNASIFLAYEMSLDVLHGSVRC